MAYNPQLTFLYVLQKREDGKYVALNSRYSLIGSDERISAIPETLPGFDLAIAPEIAASISHADNSSVDAIYLFSDACTPWVNEYHERAFSRRLDKVLDLGNSDLNHLIHHSGWLEVPW